MSTNGWQIALVQLEFCKVTHDWPFLDSWFYICAGLSWNRARNFQSVHLEGESLKNVGSFYAWIYLDLQVELLCARGIPWLDLHISVLKPYGLIFTLVSRISSFLQNTHAGKMPRVVQPRPLGEKCFENINFSNKHLFVFFRGCSYSLPPRSLSGLIWCSFRISETNKNPLTTSDPVVKKCSFFTVLSLVLPDEKNLVLCLSSFATGFQVPIGQLRPEIQPSWARKM